MSPYEIRTVFIYLVSIKDRVAENKKKYDDCKYIEIITGGC